MDAWRRVGGSNVRSWQWPTPSWSVSFTCARARNRITSWARTTSTNGGGIIRAIGWPSGLSGSAIGYTLHRWPQPPREQCLRQATPGILRAPMQLLTTLRNLAAKAGGVDGDISNRLSL